MNKGVVSKRLSIIGVVFLFVASAAIPSTSRMNEISPLIDENDGTLSGYVTDTSMNPIEGALVRVYFHGTYEEDYSDSNGYYYVDNIPICWCYKNCTASKEGYETEWVWLGIYENTTYDFVLTPLIPYDGNLSGYVNDTSMYPIEGALVRVYFHGTYEENYTDSSGYYHVTNIPICYCLKNATASKEGYETEWILLSITENTTHDFVLTSLDPVPDLDCYGDLQWLEVVPGEVVVGTFIVENIGEPGSELNWEIESYPDWGVWTFDPYYEFDLTPEDGRTLVTVEVIFPEEPVEDGKIKIVNLDDPDDFCIIEVIVEEESVPAVKNINQQFTISQTLHQSIYILLLKIMKNI